MVVTFQNGDCRCFSYTQAGVCAGDPTESGKKDQYKVFIGNFTCGQYTGNEQAKKIMREFDKAMDQGESAFTFPADSPQKRGIFKP